MLGARTSAESVRKEGISLPLFAKGNERERERQIERERERKRARERKHGTERNGIAIGWKKLAIEQRGR